MIKILGSVNPSPIQDDDKTLYTYNNTWDDSYRPYIVNAIYATKKEVTGNWVELVVCGIAGSAEYFE